MKFSKTFESQTKKNPFIKKHFLAIWENEKNTSFNEVDVLRIFQKIKKYTNLLKNNRFQVTEFQSFEKMDDAIELLVKKTQIQQVKNKLLSNKYRFLANNETNNILSEIIEANIKREQVLPYLNKIASYQKPEDLNSNLKRCINDKINTGIQEKIAFIKENKLNVDIPLVDNENNVLIVKVNDFQASAKLGSSNWCISQTKNYFNMYTNLTHRRGKLNKPANQFFIFDFNQEPSNPKSMIGVTLNDEQLIFCADKFDRSMMGQIKSSHLIQQTVEINKQYWTDDELLRYLIKRTKGNDFKSLQYVKKEVKRLDISNISEDTLIYFSQFLDQRYQTKSLKRTAKRMLSKLLIENQKEKKNKNSEIMALVNQKMPNLKRKIN